MARIWGLRTWVVCALLGAPTTYADAVHHVSVFATSDRLYHGLTETTENPSVGIQTEIAFARWFAGLSIETSQPEERRQRHTPLTSYIGYERGLGRSGWTLSTSGAYRKFLRSDKVWDYWEFSAQLRSANGFALAVDHAPNYYTHDTRATATTLSRFHEFGPTWYGLAMVGYMALSDAKDYAYGSFALGWRHRTNTVELSYDWHTLDEAVRFRDPIQDDALRLTLTHRWR